MKVFYLVLLIVILFIFNFIVRIFGFLYKIFLLRVLGEIGLGIYYMIFNFLMICLVVIIIGIFIVFSCLVVKRKVLNDRYNINVLFILILYILFFVVLIIFIVVFFNSFFLLFKFLKDVKLNLFILVVCFVIVIIIFLNVLRGYYYGIKNVKIFVIG